MAVRLADAVAYLGTDDTALKKGLSSAERQVGGWGKVAGGLLMGAGLGLFNAAAGLVQGAVGQIGSTIEAASNMGETLSKTNVLFGESTGALVEWASAAATAFGQSKQQALDAAAGFAIFGQSAGLQGDELVEFSTGLTELASDMASFSNTTPEQAIEALGAALRGEAEPIRAYGVLMDDATMRAKALELGIIDNVKNALTPQQKILAAQALIYEQTATAQGDFARTNDGLANSQRTLNAQWQDMKAVLGEALLPVATELVQWASGMATKYLPGIADFILNSAVPAVKEFGENLKRLWDEYGPELVAGLQGVWDKIQAGLELAQNAWTTASEFWRLAEEGKWREFGRKLGLAWKPLSDGMAAGLSEMSQDLADWLNYWGENERWKEVGANWVKGLAWGILEALGTLTDAANEAARVLEEVWKGFWEVQSPSKRAARELGAPVGQGIAAGVLGELGMLQRSLAQPAAAGATYNQNFWLAVDASTRPIGEASRDGLLAGLREAGMR